MEQDNNPTKAEFKAYTQFTCCKCKKTFDGTPAATNMTPGFDLCEKCYTKEQECDRQQAEERLAMMVR